MTSGHCQSCHTCIEDCACQGIKFAVGKILAPCDASGCQEITGVAFGWGFEDAAAGNRKPGTLPANPRFEFRTLEEDASSGRNKDCNFSATPIAVFYAPDTTSARSASTETADGVFTGITEDCTDCLPKFCVSVWNDDTGAYLFTCYICPDEECDETCTPPECTCEISYAASICCWNVECNGDPAIDPDNGLRARITITATVVLTGDCPEVYDHQLRIQLSGPEGYSGYLQAVPGGGGTVTADPGSPATTLTAVFDVEGGNTFTVLIFYNNQTSDPHMPYCPMEDTIEVISCD